MCREIVEEVGIEVKEEDLEFQCIIDRKLYNKHKMHFFFIGERWVGNPYNKEKHIHSKGGWHPLNKLPDTLGPLAHCALQSLNNNKKYYEYGFIETNSVK